MQKNRKSSHKKMTLNQLRKLYAGAAKASCLPEADTKAFSALLQGDAKKSG